MANQQATIDTLSSRLYKSELQSSIKSQDSSQSSNSKSKKSNKAKGDGRRRHSDDNANTETEKGMLQITDLQSQIHESRVRELSLIKELRAQQDDHEREMSMMEEKMRTLRNALELSQKSGISRADRVVGADAVSRGTSGVVPRRRGSTDNKPTQGSRRGSLEKNKRRDKSGVAESVNTKVTEAETLADESDDSEDEDMAFGNSLTRSCNSEHSLLDGSLKNKSYGWY